MSGIGRLSGNHFYFHDVMPPPVESEPPPPSEHEPLDPAAMEEHEAEAVGESELEYFGERVLIAPPDRWPTADLRQPVEKAVENVHNDQATGGGAEVQGKCLCRVGAGAPPISPDDLSMAQLALIAHDLTSEPLPSGWREVTGDELARLAGGIPIEVRASGFEAHLYVRDVPGSSPEYVLAFRGTDHLSRFDINDGPLPGAEHRDLSRAAAALIERLEFEPRDAWNDTINGAGRRSPQYDHAQALARMVSANLTALSLNAHETPRLRYTGLSLGGGLATAAALATGHSATVINASDVATIYATEAARNGVTPAVRRITVLGDPLHAANAVNPRTTTVGTNTMVGGLRGPAPSVRHYSDEVILNAIRAELP